MVITFLNIIAKVIKMDTRPIGIFDSGVGGLTVFSEMVKALPSEDMIYLGDTKQFPYGNKSKQTIIELAKKNIDFLISQGVKMVVIACGTATSQALSTVQGLYDIPIVGIIEPTVEALKKEEIHTIGVIATTGTIRSNAWEKSIVDNMPNVKVINKACPLLAQMAEEGWTDNEIASLTIKEYLKEFEGKQIEKLILGCTHYPLFEKILKEQLGKVEIVDTGKMMGKYLEKMLCKKDMQNLSKKAPEYEIYFTDKEPAFLQVACNLLKKEISPKLAIIE